MKLSLYLCANHVPMNEVCPEGHMKRDLFSACTCNKYSSSACTLTGSPSAADGRVQIQGEVPGRERAAVDKGSRSG